MQTGNLLAYELLKVRFWSVVLVYLNFVSKFEQTVLLPHLMQDDKGALMSA